MKRMIAMHDDCFVQAASRFACMPQVFYAVCAQISLVIHGGIDLPEAQAHRILRFALSRLSHCVDILVVPILDPGIQPPILGFSLLHQIACQVFPINRDGVPAWQLGAISLPTHALAASHDLAASRL